MQTLGGAQLSVLDLAEGLANAGHSVGIADVQIQRSAEKSLGSLELPYWSLALPRRSNGLQSSAWFARGTWQTLALLREFTPDVLSVQAPVYQSSLVVGASWLPHRWRLAVTARGSDVRMMASNPLIGPWQKRLFERADAVIAVSQSTLQDVLKFSPSIRDKAQVIPNAVDCSWFDTPPLESEDGDRYVLFVGRFHIVKGVDLLLRAWSLLQGQIADTTLWLVGEGRELGRLMSLSDQLGISKSVRFKGSKTLAELRTLYRRAAVVVLPSRNEGLPRVALEAAACGTICVGTRTGGIPETIVDGFTGFLIDPESPEELARGMLRALSLPEPEKRQMSAVARAHIQKHFRKETMVARYEQIFQSLLHSCPQKATQ